MTTKKIADIGSALRNLPSIDELLRTEMSQRLLPDVGAARLKDLARNVVDSLRAEILSSADIPIAAAPERLLELAISRLDNAWRRHRQAGLSRVINATGVIIHTNLGRAPLSAAARRAIADEAARYCSVEYDLESGGRGGRGEYAEQMIAGLTGAEGAIIVNNCAAAAYLVLTVLASGGEVVISRGELVEIGGDFRVPDVLEQSGAVLREVGTTNRSKLADYERAIGTDTKMILRVHPSNYRIVGFTATPGIAALAGLANKHGILLFEDIGSGAIIDLSRFGLGGEPVPARSIAAGADIVCFSGDKLLGGPQAGIIAGRQDLIETIRRHPLYRTFRVDKLIYAALEATLDAYLRGTALNEIPVLEMISADVEQLTKRAADFATRLLQACESSKLSFEVIGGSSVIGGGSAPDLHPATALLAVGHAEMSAEALGSKLRNSTPPVIARIEDGRVLIDLRTVSDAEEIELSSILSGLT